MQNEILNMFNSYNENVVAAAKRLGELNVRTFETLLAKQADAVNSCIESTSKQVEVMAAAKDYKELVAAQAELVKGCNEKFLANIKEATEMMTSVRDELTEMAEEAVKLNVESVEKASELAKKAA